MIPCKNSIRNSKCVYMDIQEPEGHVIETKFSLDRNMKKIMHFDGFSFPYALMKYTFKLEEHVRSKALWVRIQVLCLNWALFRTGRILRQSLNSLSLGDKNLLMAASRSQRSQTKKNTYKFLNLIRTA